MRTSIPVCRKPQVSTPPPQNKSTASIPSYLTFLLVAFLAISTKHIQSNTKLPHVQPDGLVRLVNDYLVLPLLHRLVCCSRGPFWIAHIIPFSGGVWEREFSGGGPLGGGNGSSLFFIQAYWNLETTKTTFKNNIILRAHLEHSES